MNISNLENTKSSSNCTSIERQDIYFPHRIYFVFTCNDGICVRQFLLAYLHTKGSTMKVIHLHNEEQKVK